MNENEKLWNEWKCSMLQFGSNPVGTEFQKISNVYQSQSNWYASVLLFENVIDIDLIY